MSVIKNIQREQYYFTGQTFFKLFNTDINVSIDLKAPDFNFAEKCAVALNNMKPETIDKLCEFSILYCYDFCDAIGAEAPKLETKRDILKYIKPQDLIVNIPKDNSTVIKLFMECNWEEEHDMEWLIKDDKILYVGACSDEPVYAEESYYHNSWNYANLKTTRKINTPF
ncbi:DUF6985 domain-containing protein [Desulfovibrio litoralis]|uniref:DUF6985 domain-containing protein n=1 Tax=Desulfovibrio litoralis DSM 11393 TaxID=1121455 RepID=A0A1M7SPP8_9BACT|nr:hypothetical protein [Desulfovibrio litoralis]SHN60481.1 hypothetical protein SAMN02745728_01133 [Desulfovibrio litoralis DSM 11393]